MSTKQMQFLQQQAFSKAANLEKVAMLNQILPPALLDPVFYSSDEVLSIYKTVVRVDDPDVWNAYLKNIRDEDLIKMTDVFLAIIIKKHIYSFDPGTLNKLLFHPHPSVEKMVVDHIFQQVDVLEMEVFILLVKD